MEQRLIRKYLQNEDITAVDMRDVKHNIYLNTLLQNCMVHRKMLKYTDLLDPDTELTIRIKLDGLEAELLHYLQQLTNGAE